MINIIVKSSLSLLLVAAFQSDILAYGAGSRGAFTRSGWVGPKYAGMGMTGEAQADDVFSIYWNPAGLSELRGKKKISNDQIKDEAKKGNIDNISEDLLKFSDDESKGITASVGFSGGMLDVDRNAGFAGVAFELFKGVFGTGLYSIVSSGIEGRDASGNLTGNLNYVAGVGYFSYGYSFGMTSFGISGKVLYEKIADAAYMGGGADLGLQVYVLPFVKLGFVVQDLGSGLYPVQNTLEAKKYDFVYPTIRLGVSMDTTAGITVALSIVKKLEQDGFQYGAGVKYDFHKNATLYFGFNDNLFSTGITIRIASLSISYAFAIDKVNYGYNNLASAEISF